MVICPACGKSVAWTAENRYRPFCSARCKSIDFGAGRLRNIGFPKRSSRPTWARRISPSPAHHSITRQHVSRRHRERRHSRRLPCLPAPGRRACTPVAGNLRAFPQKHSSRSLPGQGGLPVALTGPSTTKSTARRAACANSWASWQDAATSGKSGRASSAMSCAAVRWTPSAPLCRASFLITID